MPDEPTKEVPAVPARRVLLAKASEMRLEHVLGRTLFPSPEVGPWLPFEVLVDTDEVGRPGPELHPHRAEEVVNYVLSGVLVHWDAGGRATELPAGGVTVLTSRDERRHDAGARPGAEARWIALAVRLPRTSPGPEAEVQFGQARPTPTRDPACDVLRVVGTGAPIRSTMGLEVAEWRTRAAATLRFPVGADRRGVFYVVDGTLEVEGQTAGPGGGVLVEGVRDLAAAVGAGSRLLSCVAPLPSE